MTIKERFQQFITPSTSTGLLSPSDALSASSSSSSSSKWYSHRTSFSSATTSSSSRKSNDNNNHNHNSLTDTTTTTTTEDTMKNNNKEMTDYHIVLIDIKETVEKRRIECTKKLMDEPGLRYCAISYRWGEVPEQAAVTPDYVAHVTSFALTDLELLCGQLLISSSAEERVDYLWVDAISIDQLNDTTRKRAIRQMNNIYHHATMILAVPDLHLAYLKRSPANKPVLNRIRKYTKQLYGHVTGACCQNNNNNSHSQHHHDHDFPHTTTIITPPSSSSTTSSPESSPDTPFTSLTPPSPPTAATDHGNDDDDDDDDGNNNNSPQQQLIPCDCYHQITTAHGKSSYTDVIAFLQYLVEDWSNRVWVVAEYHIGLSKKNMKLWFLSFDIQWYYTTRPRFFSLFHSIYRNHFRHRPFLDMMLNSSAKKNEDRFYAVMPLSAKYRSVIETQDTVSLWRITDMTSVCLRLYTFVGIREKVAILYNCSKGRMLILPSFASCYNQGNDITLTKKILELQWGRLLVRSIVLMTPQGRPPLPQHRQRQRQQLLLLHQKHHGDNNNNIDSNNDDHPFESHLDRAYLQLKVKCHRILSTTNKDTKMFWQQHGKICQQLEWNQHHHHHNRYHLDQVFIPFIEAGIRTPFGIHLVGDRKVNRWIVHQLTIINVNVPATEWRLVEDVEEFHIY